MSSKIHVHGGRESSGGVVLTKRSNEGQGGPQGIVEGRPLAKEGAADKAEDLAR
jgi:2-methylcitrate dehydratase PrpD